MFPFYPSVRVERKNVHSERGTEVVKPVRYNFPAPASTSSNAKRTVGRRAGLVLVSDGETFITIILTCAGQWRHKYVSTNDDNCVKSSLRPRPVTG